tara:strand:- start:713 stop:934 length:222 start_codon:yes stop_codon:yes gene_type:complete
MTDKLELTEHTVFILNSIKLLPHYSLPCYVTPGFTRLTPMKLWTVEELQEAGAVESSAFLWPRHTLAYGGYYG